jgi:hypothetical protein
MKAASIVLVVGLFAATALYGGDPNEPLQNASQDHIVAVAQADAKEFYLRRKQSGEPIKAS